MVYVPPTVAQFQARFPFFSEVPEATVQLVLDEAIGLTGDTWIERDRSPATLYLTAHLLAVEGWGGPGGGGGTGGGGAAVTGSPKKRKVGDVEVEFGSLSNGTSGDGNSTDVLAQYARTSYGQRYLQYLRNNFPAVMVV